MIVLLNMFQHYIQVWRETVVTIENYLSVMFLASEELVMGNMKFTTFDLGGHAQGRSIFEGDELNASFSFKHVVYGKTIFRQWIPSSFLLMLSIEHGLLKRKPNSTYVFRSHHNHCNLFVHLELINWWTSSQCTHCRSGKQNRSPGRSQWTRTSLRSRHLYSDNRQRQCRSFGHSWSTDGIIHV